MASEHSRVVTSLLGRAHTPKVAHQIWADKIQHRNLYLRTTSPLPPDIRAIRRKERDTRARARLKQKPKPISNRERRRLGLYEIPRDRQKYALYEPLLRLWRGYARELLGTEVYTGGQSAAAKLSAAEMQGAEVQVVRSSCPSRVGIRGIVVKDARFVFEIITPKNQLKMVPKEGTMFRVEIPVDDPSTDTGGEEAAKEGEGDNASAEKAPRRFVFEILGDQFLLRGADRANKKFKSHFLEKV